MASSMASNAVARGRTRSIHHGTKRKRQPPTSIICAVRVTDTAQVLRRLVAAPLREQSLREQKLREQSLREQHALEQNAREKSLQQGLGQQKRQDAWSQTLETLVSSPAPLGSVRTSLELLNAPVLDMQRILACPAFFGLSDPLV